MHTEAGAHTRTDAYRVAHTDAYRGSRKHTQMHTEADKHTHTQMAGVHIAVYHSLSVSRVQIPVDLRGVAARLVPSTSASQLHCPTFNHEGIK